MRILLLSREYPPETAYGGIATYAHAQAHALRTLGHDVVVLSLAPDGRHAGAASDRGVEVHRIPDRPHRVFRRTREIVEWSARARRLAESLPPFDAVEAPDWRGEGIAFARRTGRSGDGPPLVVRLHAPLALVSRWHDERRTPDLEASIRVERRAILWADARLANSRFLAGAVARAAALSPEAIDVLPCPLPPLDEPRVAPAALRERLSLGRRPVLLFAGRIEPRKGIVFLLEAFARLRRIVPDAALVLVGKDCPLHGDSGLSTLTIAARRAGLAGEIGRSVFAPGPVPRSEMAAWYRLADVFAQPARVEAFGFTTAEAVSQGVPVVGVRAGGTPEIVDDGETGFLVDPLDSGAFASSVARLLRDTALRREIGAAGIFRARERFDPVSIARQSVGVYEKAASRRRRRFLTVSFGGFGAELARRLPSRAEAWIAAVEERTLEDLWPHYFHWEALALLRALSFPDLRGKKVLEPGSGHGVVSALLAILGAEVTLVDSDVDALREGREAARRFGAPRLPHCILGDIFRLPVRDGTFDFVWNDGVLEHFEEPEQALAEMARAAKPGGKVALLLPASATLHTAVWRPVRRALGRFPFDRWGLERSFSARRLRGLMEGLGLESVRIRRENVRRSVLDDDLLVRRVRSEEGRKLLRSLFASIDRLEEAFPPLRALGFAVAGAGTKPERKPVASPRAAAPPRWRPPSAASFPEPVA